MVLTSKRVDDMSVRDLETLAKAIAGDLQTLNQDRRKKAARLAEVEAELKRRRLPQAEPTVSDHALIRYLERVYSLDIDAIRRKILSDITIDAINAGASAVTTGGVKFLVRDKCIVTALD